MLLIACPSAPLCAHSCACLAMSSSVLIATCFTLQDLNCADQNPTPFASRTACASCSVRWAIEPRTHAVDSPTFLPKSSTYFTSRSTESASAQSWPSDDTRLGIALVT
jgi:hypothetical protein